MIFSFSRRSIVAALGLATLSLSLISLPKVAQAAPITYTWTGIGSGTFNGTGFTNQSFTMIGIGDTTSVATRNFAGNLWPSVLLTSTTIAVNGFTTATVTTAPFYIANVGSSSLVFLNSGITAGVQLGVTGSSSYDLISNFAPTAAAYTDSATMATNQGNVSFSSSSSGTFTAALSGRAIQFFGESG